MQTAILLGLLLASGDVFSGTATVDGLGLVSFPAGDWTLEHKVLSPIESKRPDCFVFKKSGERLERLTFVCYPPAIAQPKASSHVGFIGDSLWHGIPYYVLQKDVHDADKVFGIRMPIKWDEPLLEVSYIYTSPREEPWLSHAFVRAKERWIILGIHASPHAISPEVIAVLERKSQFSPVLSNVPKQ